jgi:hypothetical protein
VPGSESREPPEPDDALAAALADGLADAVLPVTAAGAV